VEPKQLCQLRRILHIEPMRGGGVVAGECTLERLVVRLQPARQQQSQSLELIAQRRGQLGGIALR